MENAFWLLRTTFCSVLALALLPVPIAVVAAPAAALYRGDASSGVPRRYELLLRNDGTLTWAMDERNSKPARVEIGRWTPISTEEFEIILDTQPGSTTPATWRMTKQGETLRVNAPAPEALASVTLTRVAAAPQSSANSMTDSPAGAWQWESTITPGKTVLVSNPDRYGLNFEPGGKVRIQADCLREAGRYTLRAPSISIQLPGTSRTPCAAGSLAPTFLRSIESAKAQRVQGNRMYLDLTIQGTTLVFTRKK
ncbi:MAG: META domain-containing protein [Burkholderiales bacterium]